MVPKYDGIESNMSDLFGALALPKKKKKKLRLDHQVADEISAPIERN